MQLAWVVSMINGVLATTLNKTPVEMKLVKNISTPEPTSSYTRQLTVFQMISAHL